MSETSLKLAKVGKNSKFYRREKQNSLIEGFSRKKMRLGIVCITILSLFLCVNLVMSWDESLLTGITAYWTMNDTTGTNLTDSVSIYNGTINGAKLNVDGVVGKAMQFDSDADYIELPVEVFDYNTFTIAFWIKPESWVDNSLIWHLLDSGDSDTEFILRYYDTGKLRLTGDSYGSITTDVTPETGQWSLIVIQGKESDGGNVTIWINNTVINSSSGAITFGAGVNYHRFGDGDGGWYPGNTVNMTIDEVGFWTEYLTPSEIDTLWNSGSGTTYDGSEITAPNITITKPLNFTTLHTLGRNLTVNWSYVEANPATCWWTMDKGVTNTTVTCDDLNTTINITSVLNNSIELYINDSYQNNGSDSKSWEYFVFENSQTYNTSTTEGGTEDFAMNLSYNSTRFSNIEVIFVYNNTRYTGAISGSGDNRIVKKSVGINPLSTQSTIPFYWEVRLTNSSGTTPYNSSLYNQTVSKLSIDDCSSYGNIILNLTLKDEETQNEINETTFNTSVKVNMQIYEKDTSELIINFSQNYTKDMNPRVCLEELNQSYSMDVEIYYDADDYAGEFYFIQNSSLNNATIPNNIDLFDLKDSSSTEFKITYKDENFIAVEDALVQIQRKYIDEGVSRTVEQPKTDSDGETTAHLQTGEAIYTFIITKYGETLATFTDKIASCQNPTLETCEINLNSFGDTLSPGDYSSEDDFSFTLTYDNNTRTIQSIFAITSGTASTIVLNVTQYDNIGDTPVCSDSITSSSGTLSCVVPTSLGNSTVIATITRDGDIVRKGYISLAQNPGDLYGLNLVFLSLILILTLIGVGVTDNPMITGFFFLLGAILSIALNLVIPGTGTFIGAGATMLWLVIAIIIILVKGAKRT